MVDEEARKTGIDLIGDLPWGTHFCHLCPTKEDLIDILVPYFQASLEDNEFCLWVTSEPLIEEEARQAMEKAMPGFSRYVGEWPDRDRAAGSMVPRRRSFRFEGVR